jgi:transcriptional regulator
MYIAPHDRTFGEAEWRPFVEGQRFGHLAAVGRDRDYPVIVPTQFSLEGDTVLFHFVARNPILEALDERPNAVLSVAGDWAFIPSAWKAIGAEDPALGIPTTYYAAVQLAGSVVVHQDPEAIATILRRQLADNQPDIPVADPEAAHAAQLRGIRAVVLAIEEVRGKFKFGGNVDGEHREAVIEHLIERGGPGDAAAAAQTARRLAATR